MAADSLRHGTVQTPSEDLPMPLLSIPPRRAVPSEGLLRSAEGPLRSAMRQSPAARGGRSAAPSPASANPDRSSRPFSGVLSSSASTPGTGSDLKSARGITGFRDAVGAIMKQKKVAFSGEGQQGGEGELPTPLPGSLSAELSGQLNVASRLSNVPEEVGSLSGGSSRRSPGSGEVGVEGSQKNDASSRSYGAETGDGDGPILSPTQAPVVFDDNEECSISYSEPVKPRKPQTAIFLRAESAAAAAAQRPHRPPHVSAIFGGGTGNRAAFPKRGNFVMKSGPVERTAIEDQSLSNRSGVLQTSGPMPRRTAMQNSVIQCMDPTCNQCPPEMHVVRNRRLLERMLREKDRDRDDSEDYTHDLRSTPILSMKQELDWEGEEDDEDGEGEESVVDDLFDLEAKKSTEHGRRMVIRLCGIRIVVQRGSLTEPIIHWLKLLQGFRLSLKFNPNNRYIQRWNAVFMFASILGVFLDPLFFFVFYLNFQEGKFLCLAVDWRLAYGFTLFMIVVQVWYLLHMILMFRTAYVVPSPHESWWNRRTIQDPSKLPPGELEFGSRLIARNYIMSGGFLLDLLCIVPISGVIVLAVLRTQLYHTYGPLFCLLNLVGSIPRTIRLSLKFFGTTGGVLDSAWAQFMMNLFLYLVASHIVGAIWFLLVVYREYICLYDLCSTVPYCAAVGTYFLYCPYGSNNVPGKSVPFPPDINFPSGGESPPGDPVAWATLDHFAKCASYEGLKGNWGIFAFGMPVLPYDFFSKYLTALYWGFQQLSTIAGNQVPSPWIPEIIFILLVSCVGLLLLALLIGNMSNFLQALTRKSFEYQMNRRDVDLWMYRRHIPFKLQRKVNELLRLQWVTTEGVEDNEVLPLLTEDLQRELRRRLCGDLLTVSPLFSALNPQVLDAFCARLQQRIYIDGTVLVKDGYPVNCLFFVLRGEVVSTSSRTGHLDKDSLSRGDFVGEELLIQYMNKYSGCLGFGATKKYSKSDSTARREAFRSSKYRSFANIAGSGKWGPGGVDLTADVLPISKFTALCVGPVEGYVLQAADVEAVCKQYWRYLREEKVQLALNRSSRERKLHIVRTIQIHWRAYLRKKYQIPLSEAVQAIMENRFGKLIALKRSQALAQQLKQEVQGAHRSWIRKT